MTLSEPILSEYIDILLSEVLLTESKQQIINMGFPPVIASILFEKFGNKAMTVAKWYKSNKNFRGMPDDTWWSKADHGAPKRIEEISLADLLFLLRATSSPQEYLAARKHLGLALDPEFSYTEIKRTPEEIMETLDLPERQKELVAEIKLDFFRDSFFHSTFMQDFMAGKISDVKPYSKLGFGATQDKYDNKRLFADAPPVKRYPNGWKWVDAGPRCQLIGKLMKNCGTTNVMGTDQDRTMMVLFDSGNKPHVMLTWSPNQKRISGVEGQASSAVKPEYEDYVFDLVSHLGGKLDFERAPDRLKIKTIFGSHIESLDQPFGNDHYSPYRIGLKNGTTFWSNGYYFLDQAAIENAAREEKVDFSSPESQRGFIGKVLNSRDYPIRNAYSIAQEYNPDGTSSW